MITLLEEIQNRKKQLVDDAMAKIPPSMTMPVFDQWVLSNQINNDPVVTALTNLMIVKRQFNIPN